MTTEPATVAEGQVVVRNAQGLHLRPATEFARLVLASGCTVSVDADGATADGSSVLELAMLGVVKGTTLRLTARGAGAEAVLETLIALVARGFSEG